MIRSILALLISSGLVVSAQATTLFTWDNDPQTWGGITGYSDTIGVTDGTHSAMHDPGSGFGWGISTGDWPNPNWPALEAALAVGSILKFDVTTTNEDSLGEELFVGAWIWHSGGNESAGSVSVPTDGSTTTIELDVSAFTDWTQIRLFTNATSEAATYDPGTIYYDNFRIVPEPASLALVSLGGLALLGRRRG